MFLGSMVFSSGVVRHRHLPPIRKSGKRQANVSRGASVLLHAARALPQMQRRGGAEGVAVTLHAGVRPKGSERRPTPHRKLAAL